MNNTIFWDYRNVVATSVDPAFKSCFNFKSSACARSATLAGLALLTAVLAAVFIIKLHVMRSARYYLVINYTTFLLSIMCMVNWLYPGSILLEYTIAFTMLLEYVSVFCLYWFLGRAALTSSWLNVGVRIAVIIILLMAMLTTAILVFSLIYPQLPHCSRWQFLCLSLTESMLACLMLLLAQQIYKRYSGVSMTHAMRTAQKVEVFLIASVFLSCAVLCLTFDSVLLATRTYVSSSVPVDSDTNLDLHRIMIMISDSATTKLPTTTSKSKWDRIVACKELHSKEQAVYDLVYPFEMIVRYLLPLWFLLLIVRPRQSSRCIQEENSLPRDNENAPLLHGHAVFHPYDLFSNNNVPFNASLQDDTSLPVGNGNGVQVSKKSQIATKPKTGAGHARFGSIGQPAPLPRRFPFPSRATSSDFESDVSEYGSPTETYLACACSQVTADRRRITCPRHTDLVENLRDEHHSMLAGTSTAD